MIRKGRRASIPRRASRPRWSPGGGFRIFPRPEARARRHPSAGSGEWPRTRISLQVRESNLPAQVYFRALDFRAVEVVREAYEDTGEDGYVLQFVLPDVGPTETIDGTPVNRIARQLEG